MLSVTIHDRGPAVVVTFAGDADPEMVSQAVRILEDRPDGRLVVLDFNDYIFTGVDGTRVLADVLSRLSATGRFGVICSRLTGRQVLHRFGGERLPVYAHYDECRRELATPRPPASEPELV